MKWRNQDAWVSYQFGWSAWLGRSTVIYGVGNDQETFRFLDVNGFPLISINGKIRDI